MPEPVRDAMEKQLNKPAATSTLPARQAYMSDRSTGLPAPNQA